MRFHPEGCFQYFEFVQQVLESGNIDRDKMREERTKMAAETDKKFKLVLSAEQAVKLDAYRITQAEERAKKFQQQK